MYSVDNLYEQMMQTRKEVGPHKVEYADYKGSKIIIDEASGIIYRNINNEYKALVNGKDNERSSGYATLHFALSNDNNRVASYSTGQHTLILLSHDPETYNFYREQGIIPVVCHIDNCPWNNKYTNLEWGTTSYNNKQGRIVHSLHYYYPNKYTEEIKNKNKNSKGFIVLKQGIKNEYIEKFRSLHSNKVFNIKDVNKNFPLSDIDSFIEFCKKEGYWDFGTNASKLNNNKVVNNKKSIKRRRSKSRNIIIPGMYNL